MLLKSSITKIRIHSDEWYQARLGKLTSSEIYKIMGSKGINSDTALNYVHSKVGEELTGLPCKDDIDTPATRHGNLYESEALTKFAVLKGLSLMVTQCLVSIEGSRFSCTPDAIIPLQETVDSYSVETVEAKCPSSYDGYIKLFLCNTALDVLEAKKEYFWQVVDQMDNCDALNGYLVIYQPMFKAGSIKIIPFRKLELYKHFQDLIKRKKEAEEYFIRVRDKLLAA
jgi:hypothetical protein